MNESAQQPPSGEPTRDELLKQMHSFAEHGKRFDRDVFADDTAFADWVQSLARRYVSRNDAPAAIERPPAESQPRDGLVERLHHSAIWHKSEGRTAHARLLDEAAAALQRDTDDARWISVAGRLPDRDVEVLVYAPKDRQPVSLDEWTEIREAPVSWSTATIPVGDGWRDHDDFESVTHWMPLPAIPDAAVTELLRDNKGHQDGVTGDQASVVQNEGRRA